MMKKFEFDVALHFDYVVTAATKEEAEALLLAALGPDWERWCHAPDFDVANPAIEEGGVYGEVDCMTLDDETKAAIAAAIRQP
jgi:hypothetical protein